ncbi:MAG: zf-HC2 domain-containing protein, partial [Gemmiger sp.]
MTKDYEAIPCEVCRDLAPLVADGVASEQSAALVRAHLAACPACAAEWPG